MYLKTKWFQVALSTAKNHAYRTVYTHTNTHTGLKKSTRNPWMVFQKEIASF